MSAAAWLRVLLLAALAPAALQSVDAATIEASLRSPTSAASSGASTSYKSADDSADRLLSFSPSFAASTYQLDEIDKRLPAARSSASRYQPVDDPDDRPPSGRFLHVTDFHPDKFYKPGAAISAGCHSNKPKKEKERAGYWGSPLSGCDSPRHLIAESLDWVKRNWLPEPSDPAEGKGDRESNDNDARAEFDFIIWTGDSARHDIDNKYPRTREEIYNSNEWCLSLLQEAFPDTPIVPTIGNNDIFPHNIMWPGPNDVIDAYSGLWGDIIPEYQFHTFQLGGYFNIEVIPNKLAVLSLNTLYWYDSNKVVDGCKGSKKKKKKKGKKKKKKKKGKKGQLADEMEVEEEEDEDEEEYDYLPLTDNEIFEDLKTKDPGTVQLDWLQAQLYQFRERGMYVHLMGHVPPTAGNYFEDCYDVFTDIVLHYQDTIVGQHFGHMNIDAFFVQEDAEAVRKDLALRPVEHSEQQASIPVLSPPDAAIPDSNLISVRALTDDLRKDYAILPGSSRTNDSYYHYFFVAPSLVPTFYPGARIWTYNTSGITYESPDSEQLSARMRESENLREDLYELYQKGNTQQQVFSSGSSPSPSSNDSVSIFSDDFSSRLHNPFTSLGRKHRRPGEDRSKQPKKKIPRHASRHSPVRQNGPFSLLGYSQWVLDLDKANEDYEKAKLAALASADIVDESSLTEEELLKLMKETSPSTSHLNFYLEYATYTPQDLWGDLISSTAQGSGDDDDDDQYKGFQPSHVPVPRHLLREELDRRGLSIADLLRKADTATLDTDAEVATDGDRDAETSTAEDVTMHTSKSKHRKKLHLPKSLKHLTDYNLESVTVKEMLKLARRLAVDDKLWKRFRKRVFEESGASQ